MEEKEEEHGQEEEAEEEEEEEEEKEGEEEEGEKEEQEKEGEEEQLSKQEGRRMRIGDIRSHVPEVRFQNTWFAVRAAVFVVRIVAGIALGR